MLWKAQFIKQNQVGTLTATAYFPPLSHAARLVSLQTSLPPALRVELFDATAGRALMAAPVPLWALITPQPPTNRGQHPPRRDWLTGYQVPAGHEIRATIYAPADADEIAAIPEGWLTLAYV